MHGLKMEASAAAAMPFAGARSQPVTFEKIPTATILKVKKGDRIYRQNDAAEAMFRVEEGIVGFSVISGDKEAFLALFGPGSFFGNLRLAGMRRRGGTAIALTPCTVQRIDRAALLQHLHEDRLALESFVAQLVERNIEYAADLCGHLFDTSEERLLRLLVKLCRLGARNGDTVELGLKITHEMMAEMVGTTRSRVTFFMNRFRQAGIVEYGRTLLIHVPALTARAGELPRVPFTTES